MGFNSALLEHNLQSELKRRHIVARSTAGPGVWLSFVLPCAVIVGAWKFPNSSTLYQCAGAVSLGLLITTILLIIKAHYGSKLKFAFTALYCVPGAVLTNVMLFSIFKNSFLTSIIGGVFSSYFYAFGLVMLLRACPQCFTFGEASVIVQAVALFFYAALMNVCDRLYHGLNSVICLDTSTLIMQIGWLGIFLICSSVYYFPRLRMVYIFYGFSVAILVGIVVPFLHIVIKMNPVIWILELLASDFATLLLVVYWAACSLLAVTAVNRQIRVQRKASTVVRKYFHLLAVAVFIPGLVQQKICLLYLSTGVVMALFLVLEMLRILHMPPLGSVLHEAFSMFADDKDQGGLSLTPMYLLAGCSLPLWLHPVPSLPALLPLLSGILTIGIGDTAASICGTLFGCHHWQGGLKTIEGTLGCFFSQTIVVVLLTCAGFLKPSAIVWIQCLCGITVTSLIEAKTDQIDNLALPLVMYLFLL